MSGSGGGDFYADSRNVTHVWICEQIKAKMLKAQGMPPEQKAVDLTKTVRVAKSEIQVLPRILTTFCCEGQMHI